MNKKTFILIFSLLILPSFAFGKSLDEPLSCCELKSEVDLGPEGFYEKGWVVGNSTSCILDGTEVDTDTTTNKWGFICLLGSVGFITRWVFITLMVVSPLMIMIGTYYIITAGVEPERVEKGKNYIIWATVGLVVGLFSNAIPSLVSSLLA